jgi:hypothetical protein
VTAKASSRDRWRCGPPPSLHRYVDRPAGYIYEVITKGFGMMASYAAELTVEERWAVVAYVRALQLSQSMPASELSPEDRSKVEAAPRDGRADAGAHAVGHHRFTIRRLRELARTQHPHGGTDPELPPFSGVADGWQPAAALARCFCS